MNVVDSSGWLEYFSDSEQADFFAPAIEVTDCPNCTSSPRRFAAKPALY